MLSGDFNIFKAANLLLPAFTLSDAVCYCNYMYMCIYLSPCVVDVIRQPAAVDQMPRRGCQLKLRHMLREQQAILNVKYFSIDATTRRGM